jgi:hypothetical protein
MDVSGAVGYGLLRNRVCAEVANNNLRIPFRWPQSDLPPTVQPPGMRTPPTKERKAEDRYASSDREE